MRRRRVMAPVWLLLMTIGIGPAITALAQTPEATPAATPIASESPWAVTDTRDIDVDGKPYVLSPDGRWLAGVDAEFGSVCIWDVETLAPTCAGADIAISPIPMTPWMAWAPDSSAVAFVDGIAQLAPTHDVMVFDIASGELTNLTNSPTGDGAPTHLGTAWTVDSQHVVVARTVQAPSEIVVFDRDGNAAQVVPLPDWNTDYLKLWPVVVTADDTVEFRIECADDAEEVEGIWAIGLDGATPTPLVSSEGAYPLDALVPVDVSADGQYVSAVSISAVRRNDIANAFYLVETQTGTITPIEINGSSYILGQPVLSPSGALALIHGGENPDTLLHVLNLETGESHPVAGSRNEPHIEWFLTAPSWAENDTVFIPTDEGGVLLTLARDA